MPYIVSQINVIYRLSVYVAPHLTSRPIPKQLADDTDIVCPVCIEAAACIHILCAHSWYIICAMIFAPQRGIICVYGL